jgi:MFS family permease
MTLLRRMFSRSYEANVPKFFVVQALYNAFIFLPIWVLFVQDRFGSSLGEIAWIDFAFWITMAFTEVPTGAVADTLGRKHSMAIGVVMAIITTTSFGLSPNYVFLLVANSLWAISFTFISGADVAFLYDTLRELDREADYQRLRGWSQAVAVGAAGVGGALGGLLAEINLALPFIIYSLLQVLTLLLIFSLREPPREVDPNTGQTLSYLDTLRITYRAILTSSNLRFVLIYANLLPVAAATVMFTFIQPHGQDLGIPLAGMGFLAFGISLVRSAGSISADRITRWLGEWRWLQLAPLLVVAGLIGIGAARLPGLALFSLAVFAGPAIRPLTEKLILRESPGSVRATILSVDNLIFRLFLAFIELGTGYIGDFYTLPAAFWVLGVGSGLALGLLLYFWQRVWRPLAHQPP